MATIQSNNRASLLNGLRTGGVRSTSISAPHTASLGGSFNVPRFASTSLQHSVFAEEDDMDEFADLFSQHTYINNQAPNVRPLTAAVDGPNSRFALHQMAAQSALNPNSVPFYPSYSQGIQPQTTSDAQLHAYQQMQAMQIEIARLQTEQAQRNARAQAILLQHAMRQQMQSRGATITITPPPATTSLLDNNFDRSTSAISPIRRLSQAELLKARIGFSGTSSAEDHMQSTVPLGGRAGARTPSTVTFPSTQETLPRESSPPGQTNVISGGISLGNSGPNSSGHIVRDTVPSKSDVATSWRRGSTTNSVLSSLRTMSAVSPSVKITPPDGERVSPGSITTPTNKVRPRPLSFASPLPRSLPAVSLDFGSEYEDAYSTSGSDSPSNPTTPHSFSSLDTSPLSPREEAAKKLYEGLGVGRPVPAAAQIAVAHKSIGPLRQPRGPPSGADELGPKNFATRVRRKAVGGLGILMGARERREAIEAY